MNNEEKLAYLQGQIDVMSEALQSLISNTSQSISLQARLRELIEQEQPNTDPAIKDGMRDWVLKWIGPKRSGGLW